tara:strand:- start:40656 stop:41675 length:1020 start_codon:yes stop_codon:yes gene_type:complete
MNLKTLPKSFPLSLLIIAATSGICQAQTDPLPSWNDGETKAAIIEFVEAVSTEDSPDFVPIPERVATFDNDGTLWSEQPAYFQLFYAMDQIRDMADQHPEWQNTEPFKSVLNNDMTGVMASGEEGLIKIVMASHSNISAEDFQDSVRGWLESATHPTTGLPYEQMVYQPMLELLSYLRANDFKTFIVSGGGIDFMRVFTEQVYGIPPEQVIGSTGDAKFEMIDGVPVILKEGEIAFVDDKAGKPVGIYRHIGRRPIFAAGNSDGDLQMLQYTTIPRDAEDTTPRMGIIVRHTDADREWAYDRDSKIGHLDQALDMADGQGWIVIDMAGDWSQIYPSDSE